MRRPAQTPVGLLISSTALEQATRDGAETLPLETGGILLGFRASDLIVITRTVTVPDPRSSRRSYLRRRGRAQSQMTAALQDAPAVVGYVGEWHTHPADHPPSSIDTTALGAIARSTTKPVALIVLARTTGSDWRHHALVAIRDRWPVPAVAPVTVWPTALTTTTEDAANLESAACSATHPAQETP